MSTSIFPIHRSFIPAKSNSTQKMPNRFLQSSPRFSARQEDKGNTLKSGTQKLALSGLGYLKQGIEKAIAVLSPTPTVTEPKVLFHTKFLELCEIKSAELGIPWIFARSPIAKGVVVVLPIHQGDVILIEQKRPPVEVLKGKRTKGVIEFPAGLIGDVKGREEEDALHAAKTELLEETGYQGQQFTYMGRAATSPGMSTEVVQYIKAENLKKVSNKLGVDGEKIIAVHRISLAKIDGWLKEKEAEGYVINASIFSGLHFLRHSSESEATPQT